MRYDAAKRLVAAARGDRDVPNRLVQAGEAIADAIRLWNMRMCWAFTRTTVSGIDVAEGQSDVVIEGLRRVSSARLSGPEERKLEYAPRSYIENNSSRPDDDGRVSSYDLYLLNGKQTIRLWRTPTEAQVMTVTYYAYIPIPTAEDEELNIPDDYLIALLDMARYYYLRNFSSELERARVYKEDAEMGMARALRDDKRHPDYKERHMAANETTYPLFFADETIVEE